MINLRVLRGQNKHSCFNMNVYENYFFEFENKRILIPILTVFLKLGKYLPHSVLALASYCAATRCIA